MADNEVQKLIKELNKKYGLSLVAIASKMNYSYSSVYYWLHGKRKPNYLVIDKLKRMLNGYKAQERKENE